MSNTLKVGAMAPDFKAQSYTAGQSKFPEVSLRDFQGKWVCLFFYPLDFTFVCPTEITAFDAAYKNFKEAGCEILGCSVDSNYSHLAWSKIAPKEGGIGKLQFPLIADINKEVGKNFGVLLPAGI